MSGFRLRLDVRATPKVKRVAEELHRRVQEAMSVIFEEREYLARLGATEFVVSSDTNERYIDCHGCEYKHYQCGVFGSERLCSACATDRHSEEVGHGG